MNARRPLRLGGVWLAAVLAATWLVALASPDLVDAVAALTAGTVAAAGFSAWLVWAAALAASVCAGWFAVASTMVVASAVRGQPNPTVPGCPTWLRRGLLAACGVAIVGGATGVPAGAEPGHPGSPPPAVRLVQGLPLPDRTTDGAGPAPSAAALPAGAPTVIVGPGDCLWRLAEASLPRDATDAQISRRWHRIYALNRAAIGADPDLIQPGQRLRLPPTRRGAR